MRFLFSKVKKKPHFSGGDLAKEKGPEGPLVILILHA
jgi:hypothetical protein